MPLRIPSTHTYDQSLDDVAPDVEPAEDDPDEVSPADPTRDEDFDEGEVDPYLDRFFAESAASGGQVRPRRAHLAIAHVDGELVPIVVGIARPLARDLWPGVLDKAHALKAIGDAIVGHYGAALLEDDGPGASLPLLKQHEVVQAIGGDSTSTWKTRVSKIVRDEALELPGGRVLPLHQFIARGAGRPAAAVEWEAAAEVLADHPQWRLTDLVPKMFDRMGDRRSADPDLRVRKRVEERYRRRLGYIVTELQKAIKVRGDSADAKIAQAFVAAHKLPPHLEAAFTRAVGALRARAVRR